MPSRFFRIVFIHCLLLCTVGTASANPIDSLKLVFQKHPTDSMGVDALNALSKSYFNDNPDTAIIIANSARALEGNDAPGEIHAGLGGCLTDLRRNRQGGPLGNNGAGHNVVADSTSAGDWWWW